MADSLAGPQATRFPGLTALVMALAGCASSIPPSPSASTHEPTAAVSHFRGLSVLEAVGYFEQFTLECLGPEQPSPDSREWLCRHHEEDGAAATEVRIVGDEAGVSQLVGISHRQPANDAVSFLAGVVASLVASGSDGEAIRLWAADHPEMGGRWTFDGAAVELQPHSDARAIVVDPGPGP